MLAVIPLLAGAGACSSAGNSGAPVVDASVEATTANDGGAGLDATATATDAETDAADESDASPDVAPVGPDQIARLRLGGYHGCALFGDGSLWCWGNNMAGQLGTAPDGAKHPTPVRIAGLPVVVDFALGRYHTCVRTLGGALMCWGLNAHHQLGHDNSGDTDCSIFGGAAKCSPTPTTVANVTDVAAMALGYTQTCVRTAGGAVACWGGNADGELGHDAGDESCNVYGSPAPCNATPSAVTGLPPVTSIGAGYSHTLAVGAGDAAVFTWGGNGSAQLGLGPADDGPHPMPAATSLSGATGLASQGGSSDFSCALLPDGGASCWGDNADWESSPGVDAGATVTQPTTTVLTDVVDLELGSYHACALTKARMVECWGYSEVGQLAHDPETDPVSSSGDLYLGTPAVVAGLSNVTQIAVGGFTSCALLSDGTVWCWGRNDNGEAGHSGNVAAFIPTQVLGLDNRADGGVEAGNDAGLGAADAH
jgi:alpha-tubulin suppressor-like RCC1 family protein